MLQNSIKNNKQSNKTDQKENSNNNHNNGFEKFPRICGTLLNPSFFFLSLSDFLKIS